MSKYKCEYFSKITGEKVMVIMPDREDFFDIVSRKDIDLTKDIKVFEKRFSWELAYHISNGKRILKDFSEDREKQAKKQLEAEKQQEHINNIAKFMTTEICPSRRENQSYFEIMYDAFFNHEDVSKPKLSILKDDKNTEAK